jgi:AbrB family looped-hinge helix DNA binding protein
MMMNLAKVSANGQITVPVEIRRALKLKEGDKVLFFRRDDGQITIGNASAPAIRKAQAAFTGAAEKLGNPTEEDIQSWVDDIR